MSKTPVQQYKMLNEHIRNDNNPHSVISEQIGEPVSHKHSADDISSLIPVGGGGTGANNAAAARTNLGFTIANLGITATAAELNLLDGVTTTTAQLNYLNTLTGNVQTQLNSKSNTSHTHSAVSSSANGLMTPAQLSKLNGITESADAVSFTQSLSSGTKVGAITINGTATNLYAPTNTDTHYTTGLKVGASATATANAAATNGNVYLNVLDNTTVRDSHKIVGSGATTVTSDASGVITIASTNTVYTHPTTAGYKHIPSGGSSGQILRWSSAGTAAWGADNNTTYTLSSFGITATATELNYTDGVTSNIQTQLNNKLALRPAGIELQPTSTTANNGGFIDFHYNQSTADYTSRIVEFASGTLTFTSNISLYNNKAIISNNSSGTACNILTLNSANNVVLNNDMTGGTFIGTSTGYLYSMPQAGVYDVIITQKFLLPVGFSTYLSDTTQNAANLTSYYDYPDMYWNHVGNVINHIFGSGTGTRLVLGRTGSDTYSGFGSWAPILAWKVADSFIAIGGVFGNFVIKYGNNTTGFNYSYTMITSGNIGSQTVAHSAHSGYLVAPGTANYGTIVSSQGNLIPTDRTGGTTMSGVIGCGSTQNLWQNVYAKNGTIQTSDIRLKTDIESISDDIATRFIDRLNPVWYNRVDGDRRHAGLIAQEVRDVMDELDTTRFGALIRSCTKLSDDGDSIDLPQDEFDDGESWYGLRYEEFIAPLIKYCQTLKKQVMDLTERVYTLES